jgi:hypothetical protein
MKKFIFIFMLSLLATSCGQKAETSKAKFKIFSGNIIDVPTTFPGGLMIMGRSIDGMQSFKVLYQPGVELELKKGGWDFATIGWVGANPMEGNQKCAFQRIDIQSDIFTVNFNMNNQSCLATFGVEGNRFTDPKFYEQPDAVTFNGFKKLKVGHCSNLDSCSPAYSFYFKVSIPTELRGIAGSTGVGPSLKSLCTTAGTISNITPPHGGPGGFIGTQITTFNDSNCLNPTKSYFFHHGFAEILNETDSTGVSFRGALSLDVAATNAIVALKPFGGELTVNSTTGLVQASYYIYKNGTNLTVSSGSASSGDYIYYDTSVTAWKHFTPTGAVKLLLQQ